MGRQWTRGGDDVTNEAKACAAGMLGWDKQGEQLMMERWACGVTQDKDKHCGQYLSLNDSYRHL